MSDIKKRNELLDFLRGFAIILVVFGHSIQYGSGANYSMDNFFNNIVVKIIYSFHMPLFMLISGFLFYYAVSKRNFFEIVKSRFITLIIPIAIWTILFFVTLNLAKQNFSMLLNIKELIITGLHTLWFLWAVFYCSFSVIIIRKFFKDSIIMYLLIFLVMFFIPNIFNFHLYSYMYPYFVVGYFYNKYEKKVQISKKMYTYVCIVSTVLYTVLTFFYNRDSYIYTSRYSILGTNWSNQLLIDIYRTVIGFVGSIFVISLLKLIYPFLSKYIIEPVAKLGVNSLGLYVLSGYIATYVLPPLTSGLTGVNYWVISLETVATIVFCYYFTELIKKSKIASFLLLGGR